jgi:hypothetical protein
MRSFLSRLTQASTLPTLRSGRMQENEENSVGTRLLSYANLISSVGGSWFDTQQGTVQWSNSRK